MATTKKVLRSYFERVFEIRTQLLPAIQTELNTLSKKLGPGTFRMQSKPGIKLVIGRPAGGGFTTSWKDVAQTLAARHGLEDELQSLKRLHTSHYSPGHTHSVSIQKDKAKNPKGEIW